MNMTERLLESICGCIDGGGAAVDTEWTLWAEYHFEPIAYFFFHNQLPASLKGGFQLEFNRAAARSLQLEHQWRLLKKILLNAGIRFCPIKGVDLAFRIYPHPALRSMGDFDILVHPEDCERAWEVVTANGWSTPLPYSHGHHYPMLHNGNFALELHFKLPGLPTLPIRETWNILSEDPDGVFRLPLALNLVMLFAHAQNHKWRNGIRMLLDMKFLLRKREWPAAEINDLCATRRLPNPQLVVCAFPKLFGSASAEGVPPGVIADFREVVLAGSKWGASGYEILMSGSKRFTLPWLRDRIKGCSIRTTRLRHGIYHGQYGKLLCCYGQDLRDKFKCLWRYRHGSANPDLNDYIRRVERIQRFFRE